MNQPIPPSELVLNPDGSIYHLNLRPEQIATTIFLVGDPGRVARVSQHFDRIEHKVQKREFITHTGQLAGKQVSVVSTGIGPDNIDIVLNELDALANIDFSTRTIKENLTSLLLIRIGTSGSLRREIPLDSIVLSAFGLGLDNLMSYYHYQPSAREIRLKSTFEEFATMQRIPFRPSVAEADSGLVSLFGDSTLNGITFTCPGFYGPQGRVLRAPAILDKTFFEKIGAFEFEGLQVTNFEMETAGIFGLAKILGHRAASCNAILANRLTNEFSKYHLKAENKLIAFALEKVTG